MKDKKLSTTELNKAAQLLIKGDVVAMPTETVYGLAGLISNQQSLERIFSVKKRPFFDPLIVHVHSIKQVYDIAEQIPDVILFLMKKFWPGPITFILPKKESLNSMITSGLDGVGVRMPNHPIALQLLALLPAPVAAPSANLFGKTSPTTAAHVKSEFGDSIFVLDGGDSQIGVESTVVGFNENQLLIFRPGAIIKEEIENELKSNSLFSSYEVAFSKSPVAPGQLKHHYMPRVPLIIVDEDQVTYKTTGADFEFVGLDKNKIMKDLNLTNWVPCELRLSDKSVVASRELYSQLRLLSESGANFIFVRRKSSQKNELWTAIWDRLEKAATLNFVSKK